MCPTPNCGGAGFTFDIFPTAPDHPANAGWTYCDDDEEAWAEAFETRTRPSTTRPEPGYKMLDELFGDLDDDLEGEEWKLGLQPGEPAGANMRAVARAVGRVGRARNPL